MYITDENTQIKDKVKDFLKTHLITLLIAVLLVSILIFNNGQGFMPALFIFGLFYGFKYVRVFIISSGYDIAGALALFLLPFFIGALIGIFVLTWRILKALFNLAMLLIYLVSQKATSVKTA